MYISIYTYIQSLRAFRRPPCWRFDPLKIRRKKHPKISKNRRNSAKKANGEGSWGSKFPQLAPKGTKIETIKDTRAPKRAPRQPKELPRWPQEGPKGGKGGAKNLQIEAKRRQNGSR